MSLIKEIIIPDNQRKRTTLANNLSYDLLEIHQDRVVGFSDGEQSMTWYFENYSGIDFVKANMNSQFAQIVFLTGINSKNRAVGLDLLASQNLNAIKDTNRILLCSGMFSFTKTNDFANEISQEIKSAYDAFKKSPQPLNNGISIADEITKFKKLLDDGVITQEEFDTRKKQLLTV